jgi:hypothetical protein
MRRLIQCFTKCFSKKKEERSTTTIDEIKFELIQHLTSVIEKSINEKVNEIFNTSIINQIEQSLKSQSKLVRKTLEVELIRDLKQMEFEIVSHITTKLTENIQNRIRDNFDGIEENLREIAENILENHKKEFESQLSEFYKTKNQLLNNQSLNNQSLNNQSLNNQSLNNQSLNNQQSTLYDTAETLSEEDLTEDYLENIFSLRNINTIQEESLIEFKTNAERYQASYNNTDEYFWGIGIENETYLEGTPINLKGKTIVNYLGRERYSLDYTKSYDLDDIREKMLSIYKPDEFYSISRMINSHSFTKIDINGNHKTTYEKEPKPNLSFDGNSVLDRWFSYDPQIKSKLDPESKDKTNIFFDGDTIEFITEHFYKTNTFDCSRELIERRDWFLNRLNEFKRKSNLWNDIGELTFVEKHPGLNIFRTQSNKIVLFNNTTLHFHITLPTAIKNGIIIDKDKFIEIHSNAIRALQWFEPFFIATLGSPDIFQNIYEKYYGDSRDKVYFSGGSMRATLSRYIGIGTYDTQVMPKGKILTIDNFKEPLWRTRVANEMLYKLPENLIGLDFNFNKHYQSGIEFRILDGIPMDILKDVLDVIILICEFSVHSQNIPIAASSNLWNDLVYLSMSRGYKSCITSSQIMEFLNILQLSLEINDDQKEEQITLEDFYYLILENIFERYKMNSKIIHLMTRDFNGIKRWENFNKIQSINHMNSINLKIP